MAFLEIPKKVDIDGWFEIGDSRFRVDYLTDKQERKVKDIEIKAGLLLADLKASITENDTPEEIGRKVLDHPKYGDYEVILYEARRLTLRYCLKEWEKALYDHDKGKYIPLGLVSDGMGSTMMDSYCFDKVVKDNTKMLIVYNKAIEQIELTENDKKKLESSSDLETKTP
jgi:predicted transport protein